MKVFISQPMNGKSDEEITKAKEVAIEKFGKYLTKQEGNPSYEIINTFFPDYDGNALQFLGKGISEGLGVADIAIFLPGWSEARGCKFEHDIAVAYGVKTFYINEV